MLYEVRKLVRQYGSRTVLDIDHLRIEAQKIYALIGPNGAGKTTLLNHLAFLDQPDSGALFFHDQPVRYDRSALTRLRRQVVLVDQTPILFSGTVWSNVEFGLKVRGMGTKERQTRIGAALEQVGMGAFSHSDVHGLSGGEVKRVALARALAVDPDVLLCDEPTANVDQQHQEIIMKILEHANSARNTSVVFSTHYLSQSRRLAHQTILLQDGRLSIHLEDNLFSGLVFRTESGAAVFRLADRFDLPIAVARLEAASQGSARAHIVPELISLSPCRMADKSGSGVSGTVRSIGLLNGSVRIVVDIGVELTVVMPVKRFADKPVQVCQEVELAIAPDAVVVLP